MRVNRARGRLPSCFRDYGNAGSRLAYGTSSRFRAFCRCGARTPRLILDSARPVGCRIQRGSVTAALPVACAGIEPHFHLRVRSRSQFAGRAVPKARPTKMSLIYNILDR